MPEDIRIGIGDLNVAKFPVSLITIGLGSCIGIAIYDSKNKIGGLAHIMLPDSHQFSNIKNEMKFADLAIPMLVAKLIKSGCNKKNLIAKIAGGAAMFNFTDKNMTMNIGERNLTAVKIALKKENIAIVSQDIGGNKGRTIKLNTNNGKLMVKVIGVITKEI